MALKNDEKGPLASAADYFGFMSAEDQALFRTLCRDSASLPEWTCEVLLLLGDAIVLLHRAVHESALLRRALDELAWRRVEEVDAILERHAVEYRALSGCHRAAIMLLLSVVQRIEQHARTHDIARA